MVARQAVAVTLALLIPFPGWAAPDLVGTVASSQSAYARGLDLLPGSTVFSGDTVAVGTHGSASITLAGGSQVQLGGNSQARLLRTPKTVQLALSQGQATFRSSPQLSVEGLLGDATFRPAKGSPAVGRIAFQNSSTAFLFAEQGDWVVGIAHDGKSLLLHEGEGVEARLEPAAEADASSAQQAPPAAGKRWGPFLVTLLGTVLVAGTVAAAIALGASESAVSPQQIQNAVSPVVP